MLFEQTVSELLNIDFLQDCSTPSIEQYELPPKTGAGTCKVIRLEHNALILLFDCEFLENYTYCVQNEELLHISYFKEVHSINRCPCTNHPLMPDTFYSHIGLCGKFQSVYKKHTPVKAIHIFLTPDYYDVYLSEKISDSSKYLKEAISILDQIVHYPELSFVFHQFFNHQGTGAASLLFYESKLTEVLALVLQKSFDCRNSLSRHVKQADIDAAYQIAEYIAAHATQEISLTSLSQMAYMSPAKLKYVFKSVFHCSIRDYRLQKRMYAAKEFLYHTDLSVSEIASRLGYQTSGNFSAIFKKCTGFSPKDFRLFTQTSPNSKFGSQ